MELISDEAFLQQFSKIRQQNLPRVIECVDQDQRLQLLKNWSNQCMELLKSLNDIQYLLWNFFHCFYLEQKNLRIRKLLGAFDYGQGGLLDALQTGSFDVLKRELQQIKFLEPSGEDILQQTKKAFEERKNFFSSFQFENEELETNFSHEFENQKHNFQVLLQCLNEISFSAND